MIAIIAVRIKAVKGRRETRDVRDRRKTGPADYAASLNTPPSMLSSVDMNLGNEAAGSGGQDA